MRLTKDIMFCMLIGMSVFSFGLKQNIIALILGCYSFLFIDVYAAHALHQVVMVSFGLLLFSQVYSHGINRDIFEKYLLWIGLAQAAWFIAHYFGIDPKDYISRILGPHGPDYVLQNHQWIEKSLVKQPIVGSLHQHTISGVYMIFSIPMAIKNKWPFLLLIPGIYLSNSTMVQISCLICALSYFVKNTKLLIAPITMMISLFLVNLKYNFAEWFSGQGRLVVWKWCIGEFKWIGNGLGYLSNHFPVTMNEGFAQIHNEYLEFIYAYGLILIPILIYIILKIIKSEHSLLKCSLIGLMVNCMGNFPFHISGLAMVGLILLAEVMRNDRSIL